MAIGRRGVGMAVACAVAAAGMATAVAYAAQPTPSTTSSSPSASASDPSGASSAAAKAAGRPAGQAATERAHKLLANLEQTQAPAAGEGEMPSAVEDFAYPNAEQIFKDKGIKLIKGDGHITLADCKDTTNAVQVYARGQDTPFCFSVTGRGGYLALDLPKTYMIKGNDNTTKADLTVPGEATKTYDITKNAWTEVGETADPKRRDHTLVEIRSTR